MDESRPTHIVHASATIRYDIFDVSFLKNPPAITSALTVNRQILESMLNTFVVSLYDNFGQILTKIDLKVIQGHNALHDAVFLMLVLSLRVNVYKTRRFRPPHV